jgi:hypothetical protein
MKTRTEPVVGAATRPTDAQLDSRFPMDLQTFCPRGAVSDRQPSRGTIGARRRQLGSPARGRWQRWLRSPGRSSRKAQIRAQLSSDVLAAQVAGDQPAEGFERGQVRPTVGCPEE